MIHHIATAANWDAAEPSGSYPWSTFDVCQQDVGFVHTSDSYEQAARVLRYLVHDRVEPMVLLSLDPETLSQRGLRVVHESISASDPASEKFPHIYGGPIPVDAVARVQRFESPDLLLEVLERGERPGTDQPSASGGTAHHPQRVEAGVPSD